MKGLPLKLSIFIFCIFLFSFGAHNLSSEFKGDENFYFESAREMLETGDMVTPRYRGEERFQKPIFFYWLILLSFKVFGVNWFATRLPSMVFGALCALLIFSISNLFFEDRRIGLFAALFSITTPLYYRYARLAVPDMSLIFFMTLALYYFVRFYKERIGYYINFFFIALAFAVLIKGPIGLIIPLFIVTAFYLFKKKDKDILFSIRHIAAGIAIFALIVVPWFYLIYKMHGGEYLSHIWSRETMQRLGYGYGGSLVVRYFKGFIFYVTALITKFLPYSLFMPLAFMRSFSISSGRFTEKHNRFEKTAHLFLILWIAVVFLFFTFVAEKRTHYLLALLPPASILLGVIFNKAVSDRAFYSSLKFKLPYLITVIGIIFIAVMFILSHYIPDNEKIAPWKYMLLIVPIVLMIGYRYKNSSFMPLSLVFSLSVIYVVLSISPPFGLFTNRMERAATRIKAELKEGDRIGIGSHGIIPENLQVFFEIPVENVKVRYDSEDIPDLKSASQLKHFLDSRNRVFCVIKKRDYENFLSESAKEKLYILERYSVWKRRIKFDNELKKSLKKNGIAQFIKVLQNEIYVISNRK